MFQNRLKKLKPYRTKYWRRRQSWSPLRPWHVHSVLAGAHASATYENQENQIRLKDKIFRSDNLHILCVCVSFRWQWFMNHC